MGKRRNISRKKLARIHKQGSENPKQTLRRAISSGLDRMGGTVNPGTIGASIVHTINEGPIEKSFAIRNLEACCKGRPEIKKDHINQIRGYINRNC